MAGRNKIGSMAQWQKVLKVLFEQCIEGTVVNNKLAIYSELSSEIVISRLSVYICEIKRHTGVTIRPVRQGRSVSGYSIVNPEVAKEYLDNLANVLSASTSVQPAAAPAVVNQVAPSKPVGKKKSASSKAAKVEIAEKDDEPRAPLRWVDSTTGEEIIESEEEIAA